MTEKIKPKQCGENTWYIPNQKGFVPKIGESFNYCESFGVFGTYHKGCAIDFGLIDAKNCFETYQEAFDAFVKPVDPTPLTWDELCEIHNSKDKRIFFADLRGGYQIPLIEWIFTDEVFEQGEILFKCRRRYWRSRESLEAWIEKQKGE
jgi:hypothetical protein